MIYLRLLGAGLILAAALLLCGEYSARLNKRLAEYRGLLALLSHARLKIEKSLSYGSMLWQGFCDDVLEKNRLLPLLREGRGLYEAFEECKGEFALSSSVAEELSAAFSTLGGGYMDRELEALSKISDSLQERLNGESVAAEKNIKIARALLIGGALTVGILII